MSKPYFLEDARLQHAFADPVFFGPDLDPTFKSEPDPYPYAERYKGKLIFPKSDGNCSFTQYFDESTLIFNSSRFNA